MHSIISDVTHLLYFSANMNAQIMALMAVLLLLFVGVSGGPWYARWHRWRGDNDWNDGWGDRDNGWDRHGWRWDR